MTRTVSVLVADQNPSYGRIISSTLEKHPLVKHVDLVSDNQEIWAVLSGSRSNSKPNRPGIILLILEDGVREYAASIRKIKSDPELRRIPIIVFTASVDSQNVLGNDLSVNAWVKKPESPELLSEKVNSIARFWLETVRLPTENY